MTHNFILFDLDGVLLSAQGYHKALQSSVNLIGNYLGIDNFQISDDEIANFEALNVTNEWDSLAICAALGLVHCWKIDKRIRLTSEPSISKKIIEGGPDIGEFLSEFRLINDELPSVSALRKIRYENPWLTEDQLSHLSIILASCRDIYKSLTLPLHQEHILGSKVFQEHYQLTPRLNLESSLQKYDHKLLSPSMHQSLRDWLRKPNNFAGIMTNRQSQSPPGYLGSPEAELGIKQMGLDDIPYIGSGILRWFALIEEDLNGMSLLKPNPVHSLAVLRLCFGENIQTALRIATNLWQGTGNKEDWEPFHGSTITVYEDSVKGLLSVKTAQDLLSQIEIEVETNLIGVSQNPIKITALEQIANCVINKINDTSWPDYN